MKENESKILSCAFAAVSQCFDDVPFCVLRWGRRDVPVVAGRIDRIGKLRIQNAGERTLLLDVKKSGQPRIVREAVNALARSRPSFKNAYGIIVAPFISDAAAEILKAEGMGYVDFAGNCRLCLGKVYIEKTGQSNPFTEKRDLRSVYSPKAERILRALMLDPHAFWRVTALAEFADVSLGQVSNVKKLLSAREWLQSGSSGFSLAQPEALLAEWSVAYRFTRNRVGNFYAMASIDEIERAIAGKSQKDKPLGTLTAFSAAARFAPAVRYQRVSAYVNNPMEAVAEKFGWKRVASGSNISLIEPYDQGVLIDSRDSNGIQVVSPLQAYLDLHGNVARGEEAAEALLREVLRPSW